MTIKFKVGEMNKFRLFLRDCKSMLINTEAPVRLVLGNTSADMDSVVGSMGLAYYLSLKTGNLWTPVINCKRDQLRLKVEIQLHLVENCGINLDELIFWD